MISLLRRLKQRLAVSWPAPALLYSCVFGCAVTLQAQTPKRFPVTPEQVLLAMQGRHWPITDVQVRLAAAITATLAEPSLEINSVSTGASHELMLRMGCRVHTECLPFFASAVWPVDAPMPNLFPKANNGAGSASGSQAPGPLMTVSQQLLAGNSSTAAAPVPPAIRAGNPATLLLEGDRVHIWLRVVFAQSGHVGDIVRVTTPDRKQVYVAEVLTPELLQGKLP